MGGSFRDLTVFKKAFACKYISDDVYNDLISKSVEIGRMLNHMVENPEKFMPRS